MNANGREWGEGGEGNPRIDTDFWETTKHTKDTTGEGRFTESPLQRLFAVGASDSLNCTQAGTPAPPFYR